MIFACSLLLLLAVSLPAAKLSLRLGGFTGRRLTLQEQAEDLEALWHTCRLGLYGLLPLLPLSLLLRLA